MPETTETSAFVLTPGTRIETAALEAEAETAPTFDTDTVTVLAVEEDPGENYTGLVVANGDTYAGLVILPSETRIRVDEEGDAPDSVTVPDHDPDPTPGSVIDFDRGTYPPEDGTLVALPNNRTMYCVIDHDISPSRYFFYALADPETATFDRLYVFHNSDMPLRTPPQ